jgi:AcrR family transcriptional regulator
MTRKATARLPNALRPARPRPAAAPTPRKQKAYRRALKDRGAETRARLIEAALDVFGHQGFEGATTRQIARAANANLAAILYHFGSKEALYRAVAEHIVDSVSPRIGPLLAMAQSQMATVDPAGARKLIGRMLEGFVDVLLASPEAERWARFAVREQLDPTPAFEVIYGLMGPAHTTLTRLVAAALGGDPESPEMKLRAFTILGQGLVFRVAPTLVNRRLGRKTLGEKERETIKRILTSQVSAILTMGGSHA